MFSWHTLVLRFRGDIGTANPCIRGFVFPILFAPRCDPLHSSPTPSFTLARPEPSFLLSLIFYVLLIVMLTCLYYYLTASPTLGFTLPSPFRTLLTVCASNRGNSNRRLSPCRAQRLSGCAARELLTGIGFLLIFAMNKSI